MKLLKCTRLSFITLLSFLLISCEELTGPPGEDGKDGVANIIVKEIIFSKWDIASTSSSADLIAEVPEITSNVVDSGLVTVSWFFGDMWVSVPITLALDLDDENVNVDVVVNVMYGYAIGEINIAIVSSSDEGGSEFMDEITEELFLGPYKVTIIPPSASP